ncbi:MAG: hypothetical protein K0Q95_1637 [Bacteroidota bacterium]|jgi:hypothetical protein|nr:hypothetical protein [Bacteroidota bacterium]
MKQQLRQLIDNTWFFPVILFNYGFFYILFGETYPANDGFGTDGFVFQKLVTEFNQCYFFDSYYIHRIFPSLLIRYGLKLLTLDLSPVNIFYGFEILNLICIVVSAFYLKKIFRLLHIRFKNQLLGFVILFVSFPVLKWAFYFPVMTDTVALSLSIILLYYYLTGSIPGLIVATILLAFTWPMAYYQGLILLAFPYTKMELVPLQLKGKIIFYILSAAFFISAFVYVIILNGSDTHLDLVPKINRNLLYISAFCVLLIYLSFAKLFFNAELFNVKSFLNPLNVKRLVTGVGVFILVQGVIYIIDPPATGIYKTSAMLENPIVHSLVRPFLTIVSHFSFFGVFFCLLIIFWKRFMETVTQCGWGLTGAFALNLYLFGVMPESRMLINLFPWAVVLLIYSLNNKVLSKGFYAVAALLCVLASKIWLLIDYEMNYDLGMIVDANGSIDFPNQRFYMNIGPWMSEKAYYINGIAMIVCLIVLFTIYRYGGRKKLKETNIS